MMRDIHGLCARLDEVFNMDDTPDQLSQDARAAIEELWEERDALRERVRKLEDQIGTLEASVTSKAAYIILIEGDLAAARAEIDAMERNANGDYDDIAHLTATVAALRESLRKYGRHNSDCVWPPPRYMEECSVPCSCGLSTALAAAMEGTK